MEQWEFWQIMSVGVAQITVAAVAIGTLWFAVRKDSRDAKREFQSSIETVIASQLKAMDAKIDAIRNENADIKVRLNNIEAHLRQARAQ